MLQFSSALKSALVEATDKTDWCQLFIAALGAARKVTIKRSDTQGDVWGTGVTVLQAPMTGDMSQENGRITGFGLIGPASVQVSANFSTGYSVIRISDDLGTMWVEGTFGLTGSGRDFVTRANPANSNTGFGFIVGATLGAPFTLPDSGSGVLIPITTAVVTSTDSGTQTNMPATFGHQFDPGEFNPVNESLYAKIDGVDIPVQYDAVSTRSDGSARNVVFSCVVPSIAAGASKTIELFRGDHFTQVPGTFSDAGFNPIVTLTMTSGGAVWTASPRAALVAALASNTGVHRNGPIIKECRISVPFKDVSNNDHPQLRLRCDVRLHADGRIRTRLIFENGWLLASSPANYAYSVSVTQGPGGATIFTQASFTHYSRARWSRVFWTGGESKFVPKQNKDYFLDTRMTWRYNSALTIASAALTTIQSNLSMGGSGPMATGGLTTDMPGTGGRDEIAPIPKWSAMWLLSHDSRAWTAMLANADASATAPVHFRDQTSDLPVSIVDRPNIAVRYGTSSPAVPATPSGTIWNPDIAHQGSYCYIPYLVTGDYFYLEEMTFWASWNVAAIDPSGRGGANGYLGPTEQLRGVAWGFRSLLECCYALPDDHAQKAFFTAVKNSNISFFNSNFTLDGDNNYVFKLGGMKGIYNNNQIPGYENDFAMYVFSWAIENGETGLAATYANVARYGVDRFLAATQAAGFCTSKCAHYWNESRSGGTPVTTWSAYGTLNASGPTCGTVANGDGAYPDWAEGYAAVSYGQLGAAVNAGHPNAASALSRWQTFVPNLAPDFVNSPQYCIVPR